MCMVECTSKTVASGDTKKPSEVHQEPLHSLKFNVWCAISEDQIFGPYFFEDSTVDGDN